MQPLDLIRMGAWKRCLECSNSRGKEPVDLPKHEECSEPVKKGVLTCYACNKERRRAEYNSSALQCLEASNCLWRAICLYCRPESTHFNVSDMSRTFVCQDSKSSKEAREFDVAAFNKHVSQHNLRCLECSDRLMRPPCKICKEPPVKALQRPHPNYMCLS